MMDEYVFMWFFVIILSRVFFKMIPNAVSS
jgi:hypothetical protein